MELNNNTELIPFDHDLFGKIRFVQFDGSPMAVGVDVARALNYPSPSHAVIDHCKGMVKMTIPSFNQHGAMVPQETNVIPEGDIYRLVIKAADQSRNLEIKARAEQFERWIFDEVLPAIRRHGGYLTPAKIEEIIADPDIIIAMATTLKMERAKVKALAIENEKLEVDLNLANDWFTVMKYNQVNHKNWSMPTCQKVGKALSQFCRNNNYKIMTCHTNDERFAVVNSYHKTAWERFMKDFYFDEIILGGHKND